MNLTDINPLPNAKKMNSLMESRFGFAIDFDKLNYTKALRLSKSISENIDRIRHSYGVHTAERNPKYMELLMVRESLKRWITENSQLMEGEMGKSEAILAAKDMVDSIQDMLERVSKMQVEQLPALVDTIRDQMDAQVADQFKSTMTQLLSDLTSTLGQARETADSSARNLAGEQAAPAEMPLPGGPESLPDSDMDMDTEIDPFAATDAATGGTEPIGREKR